MLIKKSSLPFASYSSLQSIPAPPQFRASWSQVRAETRPAASQHQRQFAASRTYATVSDEFNRVFRHRDELRWPTSPPGRMPTPYQIFNQKKGAPYSKHTFYQLVKLYHPDRHSHDTTSDISSAVKTERYRLVVAANNILSDPVKRKAYDCWGAGWNGMPELKNHPNSNDPSWQTTGGPTQNATWEDWEEWYTRDAKGPPKPVYVSNSAFVSLILIFAVVGGFGQLTRIEASSMKYKSQLEEQSREVSRNLSQTKQSTVTDYDTKAERVTTFLRRRDPYVFPVAEYEDGHRKLLPAPDMRGKSGNGTIRLRPTTPRKPESEGPP